MFRIAEVHIFSKKLTFDGPAYVFADREIQDLDSTIVQLVTDAGILGWGETCPIGPTYQEQHALGAQAALREIGRHLPGLVVSGPAAFRHTIDGFLTGHNYAKAALDMAVTDIMGKLFDVRACDLLGGAHVDRVPSYHALSLGEPEEVARQALAKAREGFPRLQIKCAADPIERDIATIRKVWEAVGNDVRLCADANRSWTTGDTLRASRECRDVPITFEQPCDTIEEIASIRAQVAHPIHLDECTVDQNTVVRAIASGVCDGFGFKVTRMGGLWPMTTLRDLCVARSMPHNCEDSWGSDIVAAACVHIGATVPPRLSEGVWIAGPYIAGHYDEENGIRIVDGQIAVPEGPGLGITPEPGIFGDPVASFG
jgi:L-alanine-DL-glutamate epimerase-like enolase superfamily enzyme